jgi:isopentenyl phosphate kinase
MITFLKLGGSLITDKTAENSFRDAVASRLAGEIARALDQHDAPSLLIGHGSGSFGHVAASRHGTIHGVHSPAQWHGFAEVAAAASELNTRVARALHSAGVPVWRLQPSASALSHDGILSHLELRPIHRAFEVGLVPLVYGDVSIDDVRGGTIISTETIFFYLAQHLPVTRILLLGEVDGVYDADKTVVARITPTTLPHILPMLGGSAGTDVTGGMVTKVRDMVALVEKLPKLEIQILNGTVPGLVEHALRGQPVNGTTIAAT